MVVWSSPDFRSPLRFFLLLLFLLPAAQCGVTYEKKAIVIHGQRKILILGSIHYPRSTLEMWDGLLKKAKDGGLDVIQTHVFWNGHQPSPGSVFSCSIISKEGFPVWLKYVPRISFRTDNEPFKIENEYGPESKAFGIVGHAYLNRAAQMALGLGTGRNQILLFYAQFFLCV
ncbi:hypothetical protein ZIOFF_013909 [Zingiber officinale]|uniref:beta-galactosidase n=1 Tax=Zingiber officinale TaxID=94328 RepID=A0A8J5H9U6_ZINOF|nr:hypothetical protein ZIOFF_013909 [Zingiber officinale]